MKKTDREKIVDAVLHLSALLAAPQPGLMTWHAACESAFQEIVNGAEPILAGELDRTEVLRAEATSRCADLMVELAEAKQGIAKVPTWIPVSERLPEGTGVLCIVACDLGDGIEETVPYTADFHNGRFEVYTDDDLKVTHWMPFTATMPSTAGTTCVPVHDAQSLLPVFDKLRHIAERQK